MKGNDINTFKVHIALIIALCSLIGALNLSAQENKGLHDIINKLMLDNKFEEAEKMAFEKYKQFPNDAEIICALACVYRNKSRKSALSIDFSGMGIKELSGAYKNITMEDVEKSFGDTNFYEPREHKKAEDLYFEIIQKAPNYKNAYFNLLNDYVEMDKFAAYFQVIDLFIDNQKKSDQTPEELLDLASKLLEKKRYDEAIKLYKIIIENYPHYTYAVSDLGVAYAKQGKMFESLRYLKSVYEKDPNDFINLSSYSFSLVLCEDFNTAYKIFLEKAQKAPQEDQYYHFFGAATIAYLLDKDYVGLFNKCIKQCKATSKNDKEFYLNSAKKFLTLKNKNKMDQIKYLEAQLHENNDNSEYALAIIIGNIISKIDNSNDALLVLGSIFDRHLFLEKTIKYLDQIKERKEVADRIMSEDTLNYNYGRIYFVNNKYDLARSYLKKNLTEKKDNAYLNWLIGKCELSLGNKEAAKKYFTINKNLVSTDKEQLKYINASIWELRKLEE